uniref:Uncharacterized protein n=1 Tax=Rhizophora mucronata TaxID=61149 RepID=A0A2P2NPQ6_RHIMU
MLSRRPQIF